MVTDLEILEAMQKLALASAQKGASIGNWVMHLPAGDGKTFIVRAVVAIGPEEAAALDRLVESHWKSIGTREANVPPAGMDA